MMKTMLPEEKSVPSVTAWSRVGLLLPIKVEMKEKEASKLDEATIKT